MIWNTDLIETLELENLINQAARRVEEVVGGESVISQRMVEVKGGEGYEEVGL